MTTPWKLCVEGWQVGSKSRPRRPTAHAVLKYKEPQRCRQKKTIARHHFEHLQHLNPNLNLRLQYPTTLTI